MKIFSNRLTLSALFFLFVYLGCEDHSQLIKGPDASKSLQHQPGFSGFGSANGRVDVRYQVFAFAGDRLYRIHSDTREILEVGTGWSGTEAATVIGTYLFAIRNGTLWKCSTSSGTCQSIGGGWSGTKSLTNDGTGALWALRAGRVWRINANNGDFYQLGNGDWTHATDIALARTTDDPYTRVARFGLVVVLDGTSEVVIDPATGAYTGLPGRAALLPLMIPHWSPNVWESFWQYGIYNGKISIANAMDPASSSIIPISTANISAASDMAWTSYQLRCSGCPDYWHNLFILIDGTIYHYKETSGSPRNEALQGTVKVSSPFYEITSSQTH
jgi:hypothetical protein